MTIQAHPSEFAHTCQPSESVLTRIQGIFAARVALRKDRREVARLLDLDTNLLSDIGLERNDVHWALTTPSDQLPSARLRQLRAENSRARLAEMRSS